MPLFLYVYSHEAMEKMISAGYVLFNKNDDRKVYVFLNDGRLTYENLDISVLPSNTITL